MNESVDETALLCESCGYVLDGLPAEGNCPECGKPMRESAADRRPGSPWQRRPTPVSWATTLFGTLRRPRHTFRAVAIERRRSSSLCAWTLLASAAALSVALSFLLGYGLGWPEPGWLGDLLIHLGFLMVVLGILLVLTWIEWLGIRFFGQRRGWRISPGVATVICAHSSIGWLLGSLGALAVSVLLRTHWAPDAEVLARLAALTKYVVWVPGMVITLSAGLLVFETLVYIGVRECRYANPPGAGVGERR